LLTAAEKNATTREGNNCFLPLHPIENLFLRGPKVLSALKNACGAGEPKTSPDLKIFFQAFSFRLVDRRSTDGQPTDTYKMAKIQRSDAFWASF